MAMAVDEYSEIKTGFTKAVSPPVNAGSEANYEENIRWPKGVLFHIQARIKKTSLGNSNDSVMSKETENYLVYVSESVWSGLKC